MSINTITLLIYCAVGVIVIMIAICFSLIRMMKDLEKKIEHLNNDNNQHFMNEAAIRERMTSIDISLEQLKGSINVLDTSVSKDLQDISRQLTRVENGLERANKAISACENRLDEKPGNAGDTDGDIDILSTPANASEHLKYWDEMAPLSETFDDLPTYRWIFPDEYDFMKNLVFGEWYIVVGTVKGLTREDGTPMIHSEEAMWNNYSFVSKTKNRFDKVYAYIKPPKSSDIMQQVFELAANDKE